MRKCSYLAHPEGRDVLILTTRKGEMFLTCPPGRERLARALGVARAFPISHLEDLIEDENEEYFKENRNNWRNFEAK